jgi:glycosyltransferase 2 family protein
MKLLRILLLGLGMAFLGALVAHNDPARILASIEQLSWRLAVLVCFPAVLVIVLDTLGWRFAFLEDRVPFPTLLWTRLAGEAFNITTPTAALGGEAVKAWLLRGHAPLDESISSVVAAKTTITIAQGLFLLLGIGFAWVLVPWDSALLHGMFWLLVLEILMLAGFVVAQVRGMFGWGHSLLERVGIRVLGYGETVQRVDAGLARFYRHAPARLLLSIAFHLLAWLLGIVEAYLILRFLGVEVSLATATVIEALGTAVRFATFLIPGSVGVLEGGYVASFVGLGLRSTDAISFGLVRRVREIVWVVVGLVLFTVLRPASSARLSEAVHPER